MHYNKATVQAKQQKGGRILPAQIFITKHQIAEMYEVGEDVVILEGPLPMGDPRGNTLEVWVMDEHTLQSGTHRSIVLDPSGEVLGDERLGDDQ